MNLFAPAAAPRPLTATIVLGEGQVWGHTAGREPLHLRCKTGLLWITAEGEKRDVILHPGETWTAHRRGRVVVEALAPSRMAALVGEPARGELFLPPVTPGLAR